MSSDDTGIGLLVFDRPEHTRAVLDGLERNEIDHLYVFADGPRPGDDESKIATTRDVITDVDFCDVTPVFRDENLGVKRSFIDAYDTIFENHEKAIVFEDDCVPAGDCINYMRTCLDEYEDEENVMNVHGYGPPIDFSDYEYDVYFTYRAGSWGQATWKDSWAKFEQDPSLFDRIRTDPEFERTVERAGKDLKPMLRRELDSDVDSVGVWWSLTLVRHQGISVNPVESRVKNIGIDGTGVHSGTSTWYDVDIDRDADSRTVSFPPDVAVDETINSRYNEFMQRGLRGKLKRWIEERLLRKL